MNLRHATTPFLVTLLAALIALGACSNNILEEIPAPIADFICKYYQSPAVKEYKCDDGISTVTVGNGTTLLFDIDDKWTIIDGNGSQIPADLIQTQLPPALLGFMQHRYGTEKVYRVSRDDTYYKVLLDNTVLTYDIAHDSVKYPDGRIQAKF